MKKYGHLGNGHFVAYFIVDSSKQVELSGFQRMVQKRENKMLCAADVWMKMAYWCQRSEENGQTGSRWTTPGATVS